MGKYHENNTGRLERGRSPHQLLHWADEEARWHEGHRGGHWQAGHWQGNMLWLTRDYRLSKHHIRHIKAYDPNEGKVRLLMTETRTKNISFLHKKAFIQTFFTLLTQHIYFRTMRGVWPGFTRLRVFTTSAPGWPTGAAASGERTCGVKPKH